jgi:hypothetical protein
MQTNKKPADAGQGGYINEKKKHCCCVGGNYRGLPDAHGMPCENGNGNKRNRFRFSSDRGE